MLNVTYASAPSAPAPSFQETVQRFHQLWYDGVNGLPPWKTMTWFGAPIQKCPMDVWMYQEIIYRTRPEIIIETGVRRGGSVLYLAHLLDLLGEGRVLGVDITLGLAHENARRHPRIQLFEASSTDPAIITLMAAAARGKRTMVILDSDHRSPHVLRELELYAPLVTPGQYLIVEDTNVNGHPVMLEHGPGPMEALQQYLPQHPGEWIQDETAERLYLTFFPRGYLVKAGGPPIPQPSRWD
jgi:cephalosporin hydroxylase